MSQGNQRTLVLNLFSLYEMLAFVYFLAMRQTCLRINTLCFLLVIFLSCSQNASAPSFSLPEIGTNRTIKLSEYSGKTRLVVFWATWCVPCLSEIPVLNELQKELGAHGFQVIGVNVDAEREEQFADRVIDLGMEYPVALGDSGTIRDYGDFKEIPQSFLIDREGVVQRQYVGAMPKESLLSDIQAVHGVGKSTMMAY